MIQAIRVLLADDHPMFLEGVRNALKGFSGIEVVAECTDGDEVLGAIKKTQVDVAVLDINIPNRNGLNLARQIYKEFSHTKVVFLTMYHPSAIGVEHTAAPYTHGYVLKNSGSLILSEAIRSAHEGKRYFDPKLGDDLKLLQSETPEEEIKLSKREKEIIRLVAEGKGNKEIAQELFLSELTIKTHRKNIYQKLGVNNVAGLMQRITVLDL